MFLHQILNGNNESDGLYWYKQGLQYTLFLKVECKNKNQKRFTVDNGCILWAEGILLLLP